MSEDVTITTASHRVARTGSESSFTGLVMQDPMMPAGEPGMIGVTNVTFAPGARTRWHSHGNRQVLVVQSGVGVLQVRGHPPHPLRAGDVAAVPAGVVHWHGATHASVFTHISLLPGGAAGTSWLDVVEEQEYRAAAEAVTGG